MKSPDQDKNKRMSSIFWKLIARFCLTLLSLRYRLKVKGLDALQASGIQKGILFLPNHPAHMDPLFLYLLLWPIYRPRPLVIEYIYRLPFLKPFMKLVGGLFIPNFETSVNEFKIKRGQDALAKIAEGLKRGENFLLYPSGRLKISGKEVLGGSSAAHAVVEECQEVSIVLIRTTGLWGSSFSRALQGASPDLKATLWQGIQTIFKNGLFFSPRRDVTIEIELNPKDLPRKASRIEFNRYLEKWYNQYGEEKKEEEPALLLRNTFWSKNVPVLASSMNKKSQCLDVEISLQTQTQITQEIARILDHPKIEITPDKNLAFDLGMDSLNVSELIAYVSSHYDVGEIHPGDIETVQDVLQIAEGAQRLSNEPHLKSSHSFPIETDRPDQSLPEGDTLGEAFLFCADRMGSFACCGDDVTGVLNYKQFKRAALVLSRYFRSKPEKYIAVLLPASVGVYLVILALQLAGKVCVMLNWTLGPRYLDEMMRVSGAQRVITSWRFLEKLSHVEFGTLIDQIELLEDIRSELSLKDKLVGAFLSLRKRAFIVRSLLRGIDPHSPCVILFTSGTESTPKAVPLSHHNILSNQRAAMQCIELQKTDVLYGVLPPFHSFGFSVAGLFPIFAGLRIAFYPDPTDAFALAEGIERWKISLFCSPPSFLRGLFSAAKPAQLKTVRLFVSGAEKAPAELFQKVNGLKSGAILMEGYGITECSPILTISRASLYGLPKQGVGSPLPDVEIKTIHIETQELLPEGVEGEICVRGPNVFAGYLGNLPSPFIELEGKTWYRTGDIGYLDRDGVLILSGRLKRFVKIGGEMISLGAVEMALAQAHSHNQTAGDAPSLALCADERIEGKPRLILFTTVPFLEEEIATILRNKGFSRLIKISKVIQIPEIPLMGTGKTNYRQLQTMIQ